MNLTTNHVALLAAMLIAGSWCGHSHAETFTFGGIAGVERNGLNGGPEDAAFVYNNGQFTLSMAAGPSGARLAETGSASGLGISSSSLGAGLDGSMNVFDVLRGSLAGTSEYLRFSFAEAGVITGINFDGISDDALEYFVLESPGAVATYFFDVDSNNTVAGAVDRAQELGIVQGDIVYLLDDPPNAPTDFNDEIYNLSIPFAAGQEFTLTYRELTGLGAGYEPVLVPNGARLQQFVVSAIPEPSALSLITVILGMMMTTIRRPLWPGR